MSKQVSHRKVIAITGAAAAVMFSFCFAIVPFYSVICRATGINTSVPDQDLVKPATGANAHPVADVNREITIQFVAEHNMGMPWDFYPKTKSVKIHPGQNTKVYFYARNATDKDMTVQAIPSITPVQSMSHFHKIECFCFKQQSLKAHQSRDMPLIFNVDNDIPKDVHVITLAYTLFDVTPKDK
jgi:cytochrome c oxidase assembly protein subunit 11